MQVFTSIFEHSPARSLLFLSLASLVLTPAHAEDTGTLPAEEDDFSGSAYTDYGEFNEDQDEAETTRFFQYGRLFGVSLGLGSEGATGNRGQLYQGGFPRIDFKLHYWFDFQLALDLNYSTVKHNFTVNDTARNDVTIDFAGLGIRYYFDTKNLSAALSFANPYVVLGAGQYQKVRVELDDPGNPDKDSSFGTNVGFGLEFPVRARKTYFGLEFKLHSINFDDNNTKEFDTGETGLADLNGLFYTATALFLFTW